MTHRDREPLQGKHDRSARGARRGAWVLATSLLALAVAAPAAAGDWHGQRAKHRHGAHCGHAYGVHARAHHRGHPLHHFAFGLLLPYVDLRIESRSHPRHAHHRDRRDHRHRDRH